MQGSMAPLQTVANRQMYLTCACVSRLVLGIEGWIGGVDLEVEKERDPEDAQVIQMLSETSWTNATDVEAQQIAPSHWQSFQPQQRF